MVVLRKKDFPTPSFKIKASFRFVNAVHSTMQTTLKLQGIMVLVTPFFFFVLIKDIIIQSSYKHANFTHLFPVRFCVVSSNEVQDTTCFTSCLRDPNLRS